VKVVLDKAKEGRTTVKMVVPSASGNATVKLPQSFHINPMMLAQFKGMGILG